MIVSAAATASKNLPPFTVICSLPASLIAESTASGMENFNAQEKSTMSTDKARNILRVSKKLKILPAKVYGTNLSARLAALLSTADFICSDFSIMVTI